MSLTIGSLFSGIGGLELGLERAGLGPVVWQAENDEYCRGELEKHWPTAGRFHDVRFIDKTAPRVDLICGGFPCTDISVAGKRLGIEGPQSGLWSEFARIIGVLRPRIVVVENVSALIVRGVERVLGDLATLGYDAIWDCIPAAAVGAPHRRDRFFLVARRVPDGKRDGVPDSAERGPSAAQPPDSRDAGALNVGEEVADADGKRWAPEGYNGQGGQGSERGKPGCCVEALANANGERLEERRLSVATPAQLPRIECAGSHVADCNGGRLEGERIEGEQGRAGQQCERGDFADGRDLPQWPPSPGDVHAWGRVQADAQPALCRLADGISAQLAGRRNKLKALGNAVVPAVAEVIGRAIVEASL